MKKADQKWKKIQQTTFTNWVNEALKSTKYRVKDLKADFKDGLVLIALLEALTSPGKVGNYSRRPKIKAQMIENLVTSFKFLESENIKLVNVGPEDLYNGELKLILGLIWTIIRHYQIRTTSSKSTKKAIISFFARVCNVKVSNVTTDWNDGTALSKVIEYLHPGLFPDLTFLSSVNKIENCRKAISLAWEHLGIPAIISAEDMANPEVDQLSMMTYLSYFIKLCIKKIHDWSQLLIPHRTINNMSNEWCSGVHLTALINVIRPGILPDWTVLDDEHGINNINKAMDMAEYFLGIEPSMSATDMASSNIDEMSVAEYLAPFMFVEMAKPAGEHDTTADSSSIEIQATAARRPMSMNLSGFGSMSIISMQMRLPSGKIEPIDVNSLGKGKAEATYIPPIAGRYELIVKSSNEDIQGSPFKIEVPRLVDYINFDSTLPTVLEVTAGQVYRFEIVSNDVDLVNDKLFDIIIHGEALKTTAVDSGNFSLSSNDVQYHIKDEGNGHYFIEILLPKSGEYSLSVLIDKEHVKGSPVNLKSRLIGSASGDGITKAVVGHITDFDVTTPVGSQNLTVSMRHSQGDLQPLAINAVPNSSKCYLTFDPSKSQDKVYVTGESVQFTINCADAGTGDLLVCAQDPNGKSYKVTLQEQKLTYKIKFEVTLPGQYKFEALWAGEAIPGSPFIVEVVDPRKLKFVNLPSAPEFVGVVGKTINFNVDVSKAGRGVLLAQAFYSDGTVSEFNVTEISDRIFAVSHIPLYTGIMDIVVYYSGNISVTRSIMINKGAEASMCQVNLTALRSVPSLFVHKAVEFSVDCSEAGTGSLSVIITNPHNKLVYTDVKNTEGIFSVKFQPDKVGMYTIAIFWADAPVPGSPFTVGAIDPKKIKFLNLPDTQGHIMSATVNQPITFTVDTCQAGAGSFNAQAVVEDGNIETFLMTSTRSGVYDLSYTPHTAGNLRFDFWYNDVKFNSMNWVCQVAAEAKLAPAFSIHRTIEEEELQLTEVDAQWIKIQMTTFKNWVNDVLRGNLKRAKRQVEILQWDFRDGLLLIALLECLVKNNKISHCNSKPVNKMQKLENLTACFDLMEAENIKLVNIGSVDIYNGELKLILGLTWTLIDHYHIHSRVRTSRVSTKQTLLTWINWKIPSIKIINFTVNWNNGIALCALIEALKPGACSQYASLSSANKVENCRLAMDLAEEYFNIPSIISPEDFSNAEVDDLSVMTYLSYYVRYFMKILLQWIRQKVTFKVIDNLDSDWCDGLCLTALCNTIKPGILPDVKSLDPKEGLKNITNAMIAAERELGVPISYVQPADMANIAELDDILNCIYLASFMTARPKVEATVTGEALETAVVGHRAQFELQIAYGSIRDIKIEIQNGSEMLEPSMEEITSNEYIISYVPVLLGPATVTLKAYDQPIADSPYHVKIVEPRGVILGRLLKVKIEASAAKRPMKVTLTGVSEITLMTAFIQHPNEHIEGIRLSSISREKSQAVFTPPVYGEYGVIIKIDGIEVPDCPFKVQIKKLIDFVTFGVTIKGSVRTTAGVVTRFEIRSGEAYLMKEGFLAIKYDTKGLVCNKIESGTFDPSSKDMQYSAIIDEGSGCYVTEFMFPKSGDYGMSVLLDGNDILGSPFEIEVMAPVDASKCFFVQNLISSLVNVGTRVELLFDCTTAGDGELIVNIDGPQKPLHVQASLESSSNRRMYSLVFTPEEVGDHALNILWGGTPIPSTPISFTAVDPKLVKMNLPPNGEFDLVTGDSIIFDIDICQAGVAPLFVYGMSENGVKQELPLEDENNGIFLLKYLATQVGSMQLLVVFNEVEVKAIPVTISAAPDASKCIVDLSFLKDSVLNVGETLEFTVDCTSAGSGDLGIRAQTTDDRIITGSKEHFAVGNKRIYHCFLKVESAGTHELIIQWAGVSIPGVPFTFEVCDPNAVVFLDLQEMYTPIAGETISFDVDLSKAGKAKLLGRAVLSGGMKMNLQVTSKEDGMNTLSYETLHTGSLEFVIYFNSIQIKSIPVLIRAAPDPSKCKVTLISSYNVFVGKPIEFNVDCTTAGCGELVVKAVHQTKEYEVSLVNNNDIYTVTFVAEFAGLFVITLYWGGKLVPGGTLKFEVSDPSKVQVVNLPAKPLTVGQTVSLDIDISQAGKGTLTVILTLDKENVKFDLYEKRVGLMCLKFIVALPGTLSLSLCFNDIIIEGGLRTCVVLPSSTIDLSMLIKTNPCIRMQVAVFTSFVNYILRQHGKQEVVNLQWAFRSGVVLVYLLECFSGQKLGDLNAEPTDRSQMFDNIRLCFNFMESQRLELTDISTENIYDGDLNVILMMLWILIRHYHICHSEIRITVKEAMLIWFQSILPKISISNLTTDWSDGTALCYLIEMMQPGLCPDYATRTTSTASENCRMAFELAEKHFNIPAIISVEMLRGQDLDEMSMMIYLAFYINYFLNSLLTWMQSTIPFRNVSNLTTDWCDGISLVALCNCLCAGIAPEWDTLDATNAIGNLNIAMKAAEENLGIRYLPTFSPELFTNLQVDVLISSAYLLCFKFGTVKPLPEEVKATGQGLHKAYARRQAMFHVDGRKARSGTLDVNILCTTGKVKPTIQTTGDLSYKVTYIPIISGDATIEVKWSDTHIPGSPFTAEILDPLDYKVTKLGVEGSELARVGHSVSMEISGSSRTEDLTALVLHDDGDIEQAKLSPYTNNSVEATYVPTRVGFDEIRVQLSGDDISGSPFNIQVVDPKQLSLANVDPPAGVSAIVGNPTSFLITASEANISSLLIQAKSPMGISELAHSPNGIDQFLTHYIPNEVGEHQIIATCGGEDIRGSPLCLPVADPSKCDLIKMPPNLLFVGVEEVITVGIEGAGVAKLEVVASDPSVIKTSVEEASESIVPVILTPTAIGTCSIILNWAGVKLSDIPVQVSVCDPSQVTLHGAALEANEGITNEVIKLTAKTANAGKADFSVKVTAPCGTEFPVKVSDNSNDSYSITFVPTKLGKLSIEVKYGGVAIPNSPFHISVLTGLDTSAFYVTGKGIKHAVCGEVMNCEIVGTEAHLIKKDILKVKLEGENLKCRLVEANKFTKEKDIQLSVTDNRKSRYPIQYMVPKPGTYILTVQLEGINITNSPFTIPGLPPPDASKCRAYGKAFETGACFNVGYPIEFSVDHSKAGAGDLSLRGKDPQFGDFSVYSMNEENKKVSLIRSDPKLVGIHAIEVLWSDVPIPRSPFKFDVANPKLVVIKNLPTLPDYVGVIGQEIVFEVDTRRAGNGKLVVQAIVQKTKKENPQFLEKEYGVTQFTYTPTFAGTLELLLIFNTIKILSEKWICKVINSAIFAVVPPKQLGKQNDYVKFLVTGIKQHAKHLEILANHKEHEALITQEESDSNASCRFLAKQLGEYNVTVKCGDKHISGSPFTVEVCNPDNCQLSKEFPKLFHMGENETISIDASQAGPGSLSCFVRPLTGGKQPLQFEITETGSKSYNLMLKPVEVGFCQLNIMWGGYGIREGVFKVHVVDAQAVVVTSKSLNQERVLIDEEVGFNIDGRNAGKAWATFKVKGPKAEYTTMMVNNQNDTVTGFFTPWHTGVHIVEVLWGGRQVHSSPFRVMVKRLVDPSKIIIQGDNCGCVGLPGILRVLTVHKGLLEDDGLSAVMVRQVGANFAGQEPKVELIDNNSTTYKLTYLIPVSGDYQLMVTYDKVNVSNSPFTLSIRPPADHDKCIVQHSYSDEDHNIENPVDFSVDVTHAGSGSLTTKVRDSNGSQVQVYSDVDHTPLNVIHYLKFKPKNIGKYTVNIFWDNEPIPGTPFIVNVIDPSKCTIKGLPLKDNTAVLNELFSYVVRTKNGGDGKVQSAISRPGQEDIVLEATKKSEHEHQFLYKPDRMGNFSILVFFAKKELNGSPFPCKTVDTSSVGVIVSTEAALVCEPYEFHIQGNFPDAKAMNAVAHGPKNDIGVEVYPPVKNSRVACFIPLQAGSHEVFVEYAGQQIPNSPFSVACVDPGKCKIIGDLPLILQVGRKAEFTVKTVDAGPGIITLLINNEQENRICKTAMEKQDNHSYRVTLMPKIIGGISVHVLFAGHGIPRTPFRAQICDASKCKIIGDFTKASYVLTGKAITFTLVAVEAGVAKPIIKAHGPSTQYTVDVMEVSANTYECVFTPWQAGKHSIDIIWGIIHIPGSPFEVTIGQSDEGVCTATGPGLTEAVAGEPATFNILTSEPGLVDDGILVVDVRAIHYNAEVQIEDKRDGLYVVTYTAPAPGAYLAGITYNDKHIAGSPFKISTVTGADASRCHAYGPALESRDNRFTDVAQEFYVDTANAGKGKLSVLIRGPHNEECKAYIKEEGDKIYSIKFDAEDEGKYAITVCWSKNQIPGSPFRIKVKQAANAGNVKAYGPGLRNGRLGSRGEFTIETKNAGSGTLSIRVHGVRGSFKVEVFAKDPDEPRILTARYSPIIAGEFVIYIRWAGTQIPGSPFKVSITDTSGFIPLAPVSNVQYPVMAGPSYSPAKEKSKKKNSKSEVTLGDDDDDLPTELPDDDEVDDAFFGGSIQPGYPQPFVATGYGYQMPMGGGMIMQGWGAPQQRRYIKSTPAGQQTAKRIRKRSEDARR